MNTKELEDKVLIAYKYMSQGDPVSDVLDYMEIMEAIEMLAEIIINRRSKER